MSFWKIPQNLILCLSVCVLGILDHINAYEYYTFVNMNSDLMSTILFLCIIIHPIILIFYYIVCNFYMYYLSDFDFEEMTNDNEYHEMIYFRNLIKENPKLYIPILSVYLAVITYLKFFPFYSFKFLLERKDEKVFRNVITTTLHISVTTQALFQSFPQIIFQSANNLLNMEDKHDSKMRGVVNFSTITSLLFISLVIVLYFREKAVDFKKTYYKESIPDDKLTAIRMIDVKIQDT